MNRRDFLVRAVAASLGTCVAWPKELGAQAGLEPMPDPERYITVYPAMSLADTGRQVYYATAMLAYGYPSEDAMRVQMYAASSTNPNTPAVWAELFQQQAERDYRNGWLHVLIADPSDAVREWRRVSAVRWVPPTHTAGRVVLW